VLRDFKEGPGGEATVRGREYRAYVDVRGTTFGWNGRDSVNQNSKKKRKPKVAKATSMG